MDEVKNALRRRHSDMHPLLFQRSVEKARTNGELFDLLESAKEAVLPFVWSESGEERGWRHTKNLLQGIQEESG